MSVARVASRAQLGLAAPRVDVEVHLGGGLPQFSIVGLPATAVKESKDRVRAALQNSGFDFPAGRITVNLSPADLARADELFLTSATRGVVPVSRLDEREWNIPGEWSETLRAAWQRAVSRSATR